MPEFAHGSRRPLIAAASVLLIVLIGIATPAGAKDSGTVWDKKALARFKAVENEAVDMKQGKLDIVQNSGAESSYGTAECTVAHRHLVADRKLLLPVPKGSKLGQDDRDLLQSVVNSLVREASECLNYGPGGWSQKDTDAGDMLLVEDALSQLHR